ncbi:integrase [Gossypium australe]|uniref:Integrase n=1 Tax=Gossypium australe TaxID=47621 RepID=A0A5B6X0P6_9ROSI|nr:integrase [Gossypium australe]
MNAQLKLECDGSILAELKAEPFLDNNLYFHNRLCAPNNTQLKQNILNEYQNCVYSLHSGSTKMYCDLKQMHWWPGMKREISEFVSKCLVCQLLKVEHQVPSGLLQPIMIPEWK